MYRSDAWFLRQLAHVRECRALLERGPTPEEVAAARAALGFEIPPEQYRLRLPDAD
jgi:hypothetical protein